MTLRRRTAVPVLLAMALGMGPGRVWAESSSGGEEFLSLSEAVPPNVVFLLDLSSAMSDPCPASTKDDVVLDTDDTGVTRTPHTTSDEPCVDEVAAVLDQVVQHYDWARYGVIGTAREAGEDTFFPIAPVGSSAAEMSAALAAVTAGTEDTRNLSEALSSLAMDVFTQNSAGDGDDDDGDGIAADWDDAPIQYWCQESHVIVITVDRPEDDENPESSMNDSISGDVLCDQEDVIYSGVDEECLYDNVSAGVLDYDLRGDLDDSQHIVLHTIAIGLDTDTVAETLFGSAAAVTDGEGVYTIAGDADELLTALITVMSDIQAGYYSRSTPVISSKGDYLVYSFYEVIGGDPLAKGHIRAYQLDDDPTSASYGQIEYLSGSPYDWWGGAVWDGGNLLVSRPVWKDEFQDNDMDGANKRDIYTFVDEMLGTATYSSWESSARMPYDATFVTALKEDPDLLDLFMDTTVESGCAKYKDYDFDENCAVEAQDYQALVDFARGYPQSTFRYLDADMCDRPGSSCSSSKRGTWKLGDSPHSTPIIVGARNRTYTTLTSYRAFLEELEDAGVPSMVFQAANDGMLHAFFLEDDPTTPTTEEGEEAWAWIPSYLLYRKHDAEWAGHLIDLALYGRTYLFDGSPVVEDVCMSDAADGRCDSAEDWHRVLVVQQGQGGPVTLALDIRDPLAPKFLWEQVDERDPTATGYTTSRPVIADVFDSSQSQPEDRYVAIWGSGHAVPHTVSTSYYEAAEANLYLWAVEDTWDGASTPVYSGNGSPDYEVFSGARMSLNPNLQYNRHPEEGRHGSGLDLDDDANYEYSYISASLTVIDADSDGDADVVYFPVTTTYGSAESGKGPGDIQDPGDTWIWKALINPTQDEFGAGGTPNIQWCEDPFFDPYTLIRARPTVYYAATASWFSDGSLGLYWGTGSPYDRTSTDYGYFFAMKDPTPKVCGSAVAITCNENEGYYALDAGEGLTADPIVYAGVVYFSTYVPNEDRCETGEGRVYGLRYTDCTSGLDTDGDGDADASDDPYISVDGYPSAPTVSEQGTIFVGTSNPTVDGSTAPVVTIQSVTDPYLGTKTVNWLEMY